MQTFLPYYDFTESAKVLDRMRLGKQRVETLQIITTLLSNKVGGWVNHPAVKMWRGFEECLSAYGMAICDEWIRRGYKDTCRDKIRNLCLPSMCTKPDWLGLHEFHSSHRSTLLRKNPEHYSRFDWNDDPSIPCYWPANQTEKV